MNNITPIKTSAMVALLMMAGQFMVSSVNAAEKEVTGMHHQQPASDTLSERQQAIPLIAATMASSQMGKLNAALNQGLDAGLTINETKEILIQLYAYTGFPRSLNALNELMKVVEVRKQQGLHDAVGKAPNDRSLSETNSVGWAPKIRLCFQADRLRAQFLILHRKLTSFCKLTCLAIFFPAITSTGKAANWQLSELWRPRRVWRHSYCRICAPVSALA